MALCSLGSRPDFCAFLLTLLFAFCKRREGFFPCRLWKLREAPEIELVLANRLGDGGVYGSIGRVVSGGAAG
jgi:hypothetical protein